MAQPLSNLAIGARLKFGTYQVASETPMEIIWRVAAKNHVCTPAYPTDSVTLITDRIIDLRAVDAREPLNPNTDRQSFGNNNYTLSNIDQWLNKDSANGEWYTATHINDQSPDAIHVTNNTPYDIKAGFLNLFTLAEKSAILNTTIRVVIPSIDGGGATITNDIVRKVFLPSTTEVGLANESFAEGAIWAVFSDNASRIALLTQQAFTHSPSTSKPSLIGNAWPYRLRTPVSITTSMNRLVSTTGTRIEHHVNRGDFGIRPAVNLLSSVRVTTTTDADGCFRFLSHPPIISGSDEWLGIKNAPFTQDYIVTDPDVGANVTVVEEVDGRILRSYTPILGETNTAFVTGIPWLSLFNGEYYSLTITATDSFGGSTTRSYFFDKYITSFSIQPNIPFAAVDMPTRIALTIFRSIPFGATFEVLVCNNANDVSPTWENATHAIESGLVYVFTNTIKTATNWAVNIRINVNRGTSTGECYVTEIRGNFE